MIFKVANKESQICPETRRQHSHSKHCKNVDQTKVGSPSVITPTNPHETFLKTFKTNDKFRDKEEKTTVNNKVYLEEEEEVLHETPIFLNNKTSLLPHHLPTYKKGLRRCCFPFTFHQITSLQTIYTLIALQLITKRFEPCNGQQQSNLVYLRDQQDVVPPQYLQTLYQPYAAATSTTSDNESLEPDPGELSEKDQEGEEGSQFIGCLFSNDVCTQDEICFDDLILGRCISADLEIEGDERLQPLSSDDQSLLDAEVERLLEQGFRWDDPYTQCVLQTLINAFRFYGLEFDTTLCKAAFLPEVSVERRVDVPKKFILPNGDVDSNNNNNQKSYNEPSSIDIIGDNQVEEKPLLASTKEEKGSTITTKKRSQNGNDNLSFFIPPSTVFDNDAFQIDQPSIDEPQLTSVFEDEDSNEVGETNNDENNDSGLREVELESGPPFQFPPLNFFVRQEEDGGILIEPDHISSSASNRVNQDQSIDNSRDEQEYIIPSTFALQPTIESTELSSLPIHIPFHPQEEQQQLENLIWMANNLHEPYLEENDDTLNDLGIVATLQQQQNPLQFHPPIWFDDDISLPSDDDDTRDDLNQFVDLGEIPDVDPDSVNINYEVPELPTNEQEEGDLEINDNIPNYYRNTNFDSEGSFLDDYMLPLSVSEEEHEYPPIINVKRESNENENYNGNTEDEEELMYLPVYSDPDQQFLNRHKFSGVSKRSMDSLINEEPKEEVEEYKETFEYPVVVSMDGKEVPSVHYTRHEAEEPSGLREDIDVYEPTLTDDTSGLDNSADDTDYDYSPTNKDSEENFSEAGEDEYGNENALGSFTFNRKERLDVKKPGPFFPNSENNFFFKKLLGPENGPINVKRPDTSKTNNDAASNAILGDPFGPRRSNYSADGKGQIEYEMPLQVLNPDPKKRFLVAKDPISEEKRFLHLLLKKRFDTWQQGSELVDMLAKELGIPPHALEDRRIEDHHVQFRVDPNPQNVDAETMANRLENDITLKKRISTQLGVEVAQAAPGNRDDYDVSKFPSSSLGNLLYIVLVVTSTLAVLVLSAAIIVLTKHCVRRRRNQTAINKLNKQDLLESERGKVQEEYKQLCRDWSKSSNSKTVQPDSTTATTSLVSNGSKSSHQPSSSTIKKLQGQDSKSDGSNRSSTSSWGEEPTSTNMDISTGHMVLAYMEDHLKNKQRLEQEWVALCGYEAEPCATTIAFKTENKKKNRYPDKLPYDHNRVMLNAVLNGSNSDYINASSVTDHDPRNPSYIVTQGPLAQTVADFWQMIWEQGCVVIVMLSRLQDNGYQLCHRYWPEEGSEQYHIFEVHLVSEHVWCDDYLVRSVYLKNTRTGETRTVTQFHFRSWPAQSVPSSTKALLEFRRKVNKSYRGRSAPICVHCSDGVGRAGTYVLIDMVLNRMAKGCKEIDIAATLEHIRDQRSGMVQTRPQFEFCLMAVAEEVHAILKALLP